MQLYEIVALDIKDVPPLPVFAQTYDLAARDYAIWWLHHRDGHLPNIEVRQRNREWPGLDIKRLAEALSREEGGIGHFDPEQGWRIVPPDQTEDNV
jgi:hypothetical protein